MGILDALVIGAAGVGRGYRAGQALEAQLAEMKRKALLEEKEAQMRERSQVTQDALAQSQIGYQGIQSELGRESLTGARTKRLREGEQGFPAGSQMDIGGNKFSLPTTQGGVNDISDILREGMNLNARINNPYIFGGTRRPYLDPTEQVQEDTVKEMIESLPKPNPNIFFTDKGPEALATWLKTIEAVRRKYGAKRINALMFPDSLDAGGGNGFTPPTVKP